MTITTKSFNELSTSELYSLLQLRTEVFVVEQDCVYQDIDDKDQKALHVLGIKNNNIVAYARIFKAGDYFDDASIGRVVVKKGERKFGFGKNITIASIEAITNNFGASKIHISAQKYLIKFYSDLGFKQVGAEYLEDGIPHVGMIKE